MRERKIKPAWLELAIAKPDRLEPDEADPAMEQRLPNKATVCSAWCVTRALRR